MNINVENVTDLFRLHYEEQSNDRIVFSGRFGSGKSYFLNHYFENSKSTTFWLSPVNYSISSNENIFEYIKFDLIFKILETFGILSDQEDEFSDELLVQQFLIYHPYEALSKLVKYLGEFSPKAKLIGEALGKILEVSGEYEKFKSTHSKYSDKEKAIEFLASMSEIKGSIYEDDIISQIIRLGIDRLKNSTGDLITLIVDDLDRLDPEHIFRILNVFSAHSDYYQNSNKFSFDKIIIVCDIDNIQRIFEHRYGLNVDFEGYIDKFYTNDVFRFDNEMALIYFCDSYIAPLLENSDSAILLKVILKDFVTQGKLTVRNIIKSKYYIEKTNGNLIDPFDVIRCTIDTKNPFAEENVSTYTEIRDGLDWQNNEYFIDSSDLSILKVIKILSIMCGDYKRFKNYLSDLSQQNSNSYVSSLIINESIVKSLCLVVNINENNHKPKLIFFSKRHPKYGIAIAYPVVSFLGVSVMIKLSWNEFNKYNGSESYFKGFSIELVDGKNTFPETNFSLIDIFSIIRNFVNFLEYKNLHNKLGITGK